MMLDDAARFGPYGASDMRAEGVIRPVRYFMIMEEVTIRISTTSRIGTKMRYS